MNPYATAVTSGPLFRARLDRESLNSTYADRMITAATLSGQLAGLADTREQEDRRDIWRHEAGLDGSGHGQLNYENETGATL